MRKWLDDMQPWGAFLIRVALGFSMLYNGWNKVVPAGGLHGGNTFSAMAHWAQSVAAMGLPPWMGYVSALTEVVGGALLIVGLLTRFAAFLVAVNMLVAIWKVNIHHGYSGSQYSIALVVMAIMILFYGAGVLALDRKIGFA